MTYAPVMTQQQATVLRPATAADAETLTMLHLDCWDEAYTGLIPQRLLDSRREAIEPRVAKWRTIIDRSPGPVLVAERDRTLIGFGTAGPARDPEPPRDLELTALYVRAAEWGTGLGFRLLTETIDDRPAYLWVLAGNDRAIGFYRRQGFDLDGATEDSEEGPHLRMVR